MENRKETTIRKGQTLGRVENFFESFILIILHDQVVVVMVSTVPSV